ncbi:MAG: electron transfer flavoprotein subunit alpha/FixB family protein, partial [Nitrospinaceae bacterium]
MGDVKDIWVVAEHADGEVKPVCLEAICAAVALAGKTGGRAVAVCLGAKPGPVTATLAASGCGQVLLFTHSGLEKYTPQGYLHALLQVLREAPPAAVLMGATNHGKELMPGLAAGLNTGLATDCIWLDYEESGGFSVRRPVCAGKAVSTLRFCGPGPHLMTLRPNVFRGNKGGDSAPAEVLEKAIDLDGTIQGVVLKEVRKEGGQRDITEARIVVSGGLGMQGPGQFALLEALAAVLGAAVGASRPVVDNGWRPYSNQVGQTGRTVAPNLYMAFGISGAVQHLAGMSSSQCIVAVNKDGHAPIFE